MEQRTMGAGETVLAITGMTCQGCAQAVTRVLSQVPGVSKATVDLAGARAFVAGDAGAQNLIAAVEAAGYGASLAKAAMRQ